MAIKYRRCPRCRKLRSHVSGKHAHGTRKVRKWVDGICSVCVTLAEIFPPSPGMKTE